MWLVVPLDTGYGLMNQKTLKLVAPGEILKILGREIFAIKNNDLVEGLYEYMAYDYDAFWKLDKNIAS